MVKNGKQIGHENPQIFETDLILKTSFGFPGRFLGGLGFSGRLLGFRGEVLVSGADWGDFWVSGAVFWTIFDPPETPKRSKMV